ncbi:alanine racemase [Clostridia bacterium]|nr:alanine racemase [Clostridia bacterium]
MRLVWAEVDIHAIRSNIKALREFLEPETKIMSIIKANGYGHGASHVAKEALNEVTDYFGVAVLSEAIELRKKWITKPILILGYTDWKDYDQLLQYDIMQTIFNKEQAIKLNEAAKKADAIVKVHIKVDTGMHRIGFVSDDESLKDIVEIDDLSNIQIDGIFSHMASADTGDVDYCRMQMDRFSEFTDCLEKMLVEKNDRNARPTKIPIKHMANSAATLTMKESHLDMVRPGIILYGHYPSQYIEGRSTLLPLKQALTLKASIVNILHAKPGMRISYGGTYTTTRDSVIATLPLGYADGYPRILSNRGSVLIKGKRAPIVGSICMDQMMIDVTDIQGVELGNEVVLYGVEEETGASLPVSELAGLTGSINYEILTGLSERVPRVYKDE